MGRVDAASLRANAAAVHAALRYYVESEREPLTAAARRAAPGRFARLRDGIVHYELAGPCDGPFVVLVPGFSVPYYIWDPTFERLVRRGFRVLRYDLFGRGWSDRPAVPYDRELFDRQLVDLLEALGVSRPVAVAGVSVGGPIGVTFAVRHPHRARCVALVDPRAPGPLRLPLHLRAPLVGECYLALVRGPVLAALQPRDFHEPARFPDWSAKFAEQMRFPGFRRALLSTMRYYLQCDLREEHRRLGRSATPVLVLWGEHDRAAAGVVTELRSLLPRAEFQPVPSAGHLPQYERPELLEPILRRFVLNELGGDGAERESTRSTAAVSVPAPTPAPPSRD